MITVENVFSS